VDLTNVTIDDPKVGAISPASAAIGANSDATFTATYVVTQADVDAGAVRNTATASGTYTPPDAEPVTVVSGPDDENIPTPLLDPSLTIEKDGTLDDTNNNGVADAGETITYEFLVTNTGNTTLLGVNVVDDRVAAIVPTSVDLIPGGTQNFQSTPYLVTQSDVDDGEVANTAFARGQVPNGPEVFSPEDEHLEPVVAADPSLTLAKTAELQDLNGNGTADVGESIIYTFGVQNTGNVTLFDVAIDDPMLAGLLPDPIDFLPPAAITFFVADPYLVTAEDVAAEEIVNVATAAGIAPDESPVVSEEDEAVVTATPSASGSGGLPSTGRDVGSLWAAAVALMLVGAVALAITRIRASRSRAGRRSTRAATQSRL